MVELINCIVFGIYFSVARGYEKEHGGKGKEGCFSFIIIDGYKLASH